MARPFIFELVIVLALLVPLTGLAEQTSFDAEAADRFVHFDTGEVRYRSIGHGSSAVVFIHGWTCNLNFWKESLRDFPQARVIAIDLPGHGQSDKPYAPYSMSYFARSVEAVLRDAGINKAVLVGHSMGALIAARFYRLHPERVAGMALIAGVPWADVANPGSTPQQLLGMLQPFREQYRSAATQNVDAMLKPVKDAALRQEIRLTMLATPEHVGLNAVEGMVEEWIDDTDRKQRGIAVPVLMILSEADHVPWSAGTEQTIRSLAPGIDLQVWRNVSHFLMMERADDFNKELHKFIDRNGLLEARS